jgi:hypothetical protein
MFLGEDKEAVSVFGACIEKRDVILHNAPHDLAVLDQLGIHPAGFRDTMQELYQLGNLPQGLKAATYRTSGCRMTSYNETVTPYSKRALENWLAEALAYVNGAMRHNVTHPAGKSCPSCGKNHRQYRIDSTPHEAEAVLRRIMGKLADGSDYDPWQAPKWQKGEEKVRLLGRPWLDILEAHVGRMPRRSIVHVPLEEAVRYGCSDADHTGRLALWLDRERQRIVSEEWRVA